ncbi:CLUMA_CG005681, isoform A [Clunio marinus]|uniref:CLUMA_CG005681, isoform A n=1 Tax=Clunio marinus TaxID=568069 RepID=A0A1J1HX25_9DIPT|nr:CLUMA_CG005681, isoform A [Clunio marinus]
MEMIYNNSFLDLNYMRNGTMFSFNATTFVRLQNWFIDIAVYTANENGKYEPFLGKGSTDVCKFLGNKKGNKLARLIFEQIKGDIKFPTSCPVEKGFYYASKINYGGGGFLSQYISDTKAMISLDFGTKINRKMNYFANAKVFYELKNRLKWEKEQLKNKTEAQNKSKQQKSQHSD